MSDGLEDNVFNRGHSTRTDMAKCSGGMVVSTFYPERIKDDRYILKRGDHRY